MSNRNSNTAASIRAAIGRISNNCNDRIPSKDCAARPVASKPEGKRNLPLARLEAAAAKPARAPGQEAEVHPASTVATLARLREFHDSQSPEEAAELHRLTEEMEAGE